MATCLIGLGANIGDRHATLRRAIALVARLRGVDLLAESRFYETAPVGGPPDQPPYLNAVVRIDTRLGPRAILNRLEKIEAELGRTREVRWGPRTIDLDLLLYDDLVLDTPRLSVPHPRMAFRRFVLQPAAEVAPQWVHPTIGWTLSQLLAHLNEAEPYVAMAGPIGAGKSALARSVSKRMSAQLVAEPLDAARLESFYADPAGRAWEVELEFLALRSRLLDRGHWERGRLTISDFWFNQSLAFAATWLPEDRQDAFRAAWSAAHTRIVQPKFVVLLDLPAGELRQRILRRGRAYEQSLSRETLERLRTAHRALIERNEVGPVLRLSARDIESAADEVVAAIVGTT